jgi:hypothetical protein
MLMKFRAPNRYRKPHKTARNKKMATFFCSSARLISAVSAALCASASLHAASAELFESFETGLPAYPGSRATGQVVHLSSGDWYAVNHSDSVLEVPGVFSDTTEFPAVDGTHYAAFNYNMTEGAGTINAWLISPELSFTAGDQVSFYTRCPAAALFPDRLFVRFSTAGASVNVGTTSSDVGDFGLVLGAINPSLTLGGYPEVYTLFSFTVSSTALGRIALQYHIPDGGRDGTNGNYIAIDALTIDLAEASPIPESSTFAALAGLAGLSLVATCRRHPRPDAA